MNKRQHLVPRRPYRLAGYLLLTPVVVVALYLLASFAGAIIPRQSAWQGGDGEVRDRVVYLIGSLLHADIAIAVHDLPDGLINTLQGTNIPFSNPKLEYLGFGWGSRAFYTTAGSYSDIGVGPTFTAMTGDEPVMRISALPDLADIEGAVAIRVSSVQLDALLDAINRSFETGAGGKLRHLNQYSIAPGDAFFEARGHFNIFNPCNQWTGRMLSEIGVRTGLWTPTTHALYLSLWWHGEEGTQVVFQ